MLYQEPILKQNQTDCYKLISEFARKYWANKNSDGKVQIGVIAVASAFSLSRLDRQPAHLHGMSAPQIDQSADVVREWTGLSTNNMNWEAEVMTMKKGRRELVV